MVFDFSHSAHPGMIGITQPRRVAAVSISARLGQELNLPKGDPTVAYQIRYDSCVDPTKTTIKLMTDGQLAGETKFRIE